MNDFEHLYVQKCAELSIDPLKAILDNIKEAKNAGNISKNPSTLNLSGLSVPLKSCTALSHSLATNDTIKRLILADAFLGDEGCILIANCLKTNQFLTYLDIRGNSIRCDGAIALGQMLKVNNKLEHLNLEWNCVGIWESGIRALADGLSMNSTLTTLDLRNNKIGPHGAQALALCLKHNTTLRKLGTQINL
jgi:Ran GTPase-activating protein (RanGAP) involved in mRNA processing and transport